MASIIKPAVITFIICLLALHVEGKRPGTKPRPPRPRPPRLRPPRPPPRPPPPPPPRPPRLRPPPPPLPRPRPPPVRRPNCKPDCSGQGLDSMHTPFDYEEYYPTPSCPRREFTVTTTNGKRCVKPGSILERFLNIIHITGGSDCICPDQGIASMDLSLIKDEKVYEATLSCPSREIIVTTTDGETCVNPELTLGKSLYQFKTKGTPICKCSGQGINSMHPRLFKNDQIYEVTRFCPRREIMIVETANGIKQCVDPKSNLGKFIIRKRKTGQRGNCTCPAQGINSMHPSLIINYEIYEVTQFCPGREIVVTTTDGKKLCVNPESNLGNFIYDIRRTGQRDSCTCPDQGIDYMNSSIIKDYQINEASPSCPSREIIVTTTNGTEECVNPESVSGNDIYELNIQRTADRHGVAVGVGVGVGVGVIGLILICSVCCWKKNKYSPTSDGEREPDGERVRMSAFRHVAFPTVTNPIPNPNPNPKRTRKPRRRHYRSGGMSEWRETAGEREPDGERESDSEWETDGEWETEVDDATVQHPPPYAPKPPPEQIMLTPR